MTTPSERYRSILQARDFLISLCDPKKTPRVPLRVRASAYWCLRHFPAEYILEMIPKRLPKLFNPLE